MADLSKYEKTQVTAIKVWKKEEPSVVSKTFGIVLEPLAWLVRSIVPEAAIRGALGLSNTAAVWMTDTEDVIRDAGVGRIDEIIGKDLKLSDRLADSVQNWSIGVAAVEGAGTGFFGIFGAPIDIPAIITLALRTIHKIGVCYGYECKTEADERFAYSVLSASSANSVQEKLAALTMLRAIEVTLAQHTWKKIAEGAAAKQLSKEGAITVVRNLAKQLGINLTKRKALAAIPAIGSIVGGSVNAWYIKDIGWAARRMFQERWLIDSRNFASSGMSVRGG